MHVKIVDMAKFCMSRYLKKKLILLIIFVRLHPTFKILLKNGGL